jgi:hypothetical protein
VRQHLQAVQPLKFAGGLGTRTTFCTLQEKWVVYLTSRNFPAGWVLGTTSYTLQDK